MTISISPHYWMARVAYWLWHHVEGNEEAPFHASYQTLVLRSRDPVQAIRESFDELEALQAQLLHARKLETMEGDRVAYARSVITKAMETAAARFSAMDPDAAEWNQLQEASKKLRQEEQRLISKGVDLERKHGGVALAGLMEKGYGTPSYKGRGLGKWMDDRLAKRIGFAEFQARKKKLTARIQQARSQWEEAKREERKARGLMERSWKERGIRHADRKTIDGAERLRQMADLTSEEIRSVRMDLERNSARARRETADAIAAFHRLAAEDLQTLIPLLAQASEEDLTGWPDIDTTVFVSAVGERDLARTSLLQKANQGFMGQGEPPDSPLPTWILLAYGNTKGLPGTAMAQASMGAGALLDKLST